MHTFRVWAPRSKRLEVEVNRRRFPMEREANGWWSGQIASAGPGNDYGFMVDGEGPLPDPRSSWQPHGVHGLSRLIDPEAFEWSDAGFDAPPLARAVIYELHVGTFTPAGTFKAVIGRLDHLVSLGVTHLELMPVAEFSGNHGWGYDGVDLFAPHHAYGGPHGLKKLVNACHARGLAVLLDVAYNHLGPSGNYLPRFAPYLSDRRRTPWGRAVNFDGPRSEEVRRFYCDNALVWLRDYHCDGLRLDAVHAIFDRSARPFLAQLGEAVRKLARQTGRRLVLIAESDLKSPRLLWPHKRGGCGFDAQWCDGFHHALHALLTGERNGYYRGFGTLADLAYALRNACMYDRRHAGRRSGQGGGRLSGFSGHRFIAYAQTHDQVGNRAQGERLSQLVSLGRLKIAAALVFTSPFVPMLFQGEEWAADSPFQYFTDHPDRELAKAVREGRSREFAAFGWKAEDAPDPQALETFARSKLNWQEIDCAPHAEMLDWHRQLIRLRLTEPALEDGAIGRVKTRFDEAARWFVLERGPVSVACNLASQTRAVPLRAGQHVTLLASDPRTRACAGSLKLPPDTVAISKLLA